MYLALCMLGKFFMVYLLCADFFQNQLFRKILRNTVRVSNSIDPDQVQHFVTTDLGPNCLQRLSAENSGKLRCTFHSLYTFVYLLGHTWLNQHQINLHLTSHGVFQINDIENDLICIILVKIRRVTKDFKIISYYNLTFKSPEACI